MFCLSVSSPQLFQIKVIWWCVVRCRLRCKVPSKHLIEHFRIFALCQGGVRTPSGPLSRDSRYHSCNTPPYSAIPYRGQFELRCPLPPQWHCIVRFGYVRCQRPAKRQKHKPCETEACFFPPLLPVGSQESVLKVPKRRQFHAAIRVTSERCDSCAHGALGRQTVSRRNFCDAESLAKRYGETCH